MHTTPTPTVELLEQALALAERSGITVRQDWLSGGPAGLCELKGRRWLFVDLSLPPAEQLEQVLSGLASIKELAVNDAPHQIHKLLSLRKAA